jgi:hypothetical protein
MAHTVAEAVAEFFGAWQARDWRAMAAACQGTWIGSQTYPAEAALEAWFGPKFLQGYRLEATTAPARYLIQAYVVLDYRTQRFGQARVRVEANVIFEAAHGNGHGSWGVNPVSVLRETEIVND